MAHIHTDPGQHDITVSAYIVRTDGDDPKVLVHMHRKLGKLLQIGGHVELEETPWQALVREISEESGFTVEELSLLQPDGQLIEIPGAIIHPQPVISLTFKQPGDHYHSDYSYAFVAGADVMSTPDSGESSDLRWLTIGELHTAVEQGVAGNDAFSIYERIVDRYLNEYSLVSASQFSLGKPAISSI